MQKCVICGKEFKGYGNNALPIASGRCCDKCNNDKVIPERFEILIRGKKVPKNKMKGW